MNRILVLISCYVCVVASADHDIERSLRPRIIGGDMVDIKQVPYQVSILKLTNGIYETHMCGGSIIAKNYVLTAAHCAELRRDQYRIRSGSDTWYGGEYHEVEDIRIHKDYRMDEFETPNNDIAIMKVSPGFKLDGVFEKAVELADENDEVHDGDDAFASGWGRTDPRKFGASEYLIGIALKIVDFETCTKEHNRNGTMTEHCICVIHPSKAKGTCKGDSGGPIVVKEKQVGVVSWSASNCAASGMPMVYVDVAKYRHWIDEQTRY